MATPFHTPLAEQYRPRTCWWSPSRPTAPGRRPSARPYSACPPS